MSSNLRHKNKDVPKVGHLLSHRSGSFPQGGRDCNCAGRLLFLDSCNKVATAALVCRLHTGVVCATLGKLQMSSEASR